MLSRVELVNLKIEYDRFIMASPHLKPTAFNKGLSFSEFLSIKAIDDNNKTNPPSY